MTNISTNKIKIGNKIQIGVVSLLALAAWQIGASPAAVAQVPPPPPPPAVVPAAPVAPASSAMTTPPLTGPLVANPNPLALDVRELGKWYVTGAISGMGLLQTSPVVGNSDDHYDLTNGHVMVQKTEGWLQWYAQAGAYSFPTVGTPYIYAGRVIGNTFGPFPVGYAKLVPTDELSLQVGKLPTLIGAEYAFTFQNMNIQRGLLWNQEPIFSRGIQGNYASGPLTLSLSWNDGFYSNSYNWISGLASYALNKENTIAFAGGGNFGQTPKTTFVTPIVQNNSRIFNLIYTYNAAPWTITPYFQFTDVPSNGSLGITSAQSYGGAILANYNINDNWNVAGRVEYIATSGPNNLLYGPGSSALTLTLTPTWQNGFYFVRGEASLADAYSTTAGFAFGKGGTNTTQARFVIEGGVIF